MERILALRHELAQLLGFHDYTDYSLATKMADSPEQVLAFLADLARRARPQAQRELDELRDFARERFGAGRPASLGHRLLRGEAAPASLSTVAGGIAALFPAAPGIGGTVRGGGTPVRRHHPLRWRAWKRGIPTCGFMPSWMQRATRAGGSMWIGTPVPTSAAEPGWTAVWPGGGWPRRCGCRRPIWSATSPRRWATIRPC